MDQKDNVVGDRIRQLRKMDGNKSQKEFAEFLGIPQPTLSSYESGRIKPNIDAIVNIANKCCISLDWLCGQSGKFCKYTTSQLGQLIYNLSGTYAFDNCSLDIKKDNSGNVCQAVICMEEGSNSNIQDFLNMLNKLKEFFSMRNNLNKDQAELIINSIFSEYADRILY